MKAMTLNSRLFRFEMRTKKIQIMSTKDSLFKTADTWTTSIEEMLIKAGLTPKWGNKTGSCIMPAPKHLQSAKQQQKSENQEAEEPKETKDNG